MNDITQRSTLYSNAIARAEKAEEALRQFAWKPISEADKSIDQVIGSAIGLPIGNSLPIWARDDDGRIFECLWSDDGKRAYWWDIEGESPVDPVEFMPHPLDPRFAATASDYLSQKNQSLDILGWVDRHLNKTPMLPIRVDEMNETEAKIFEVVAYHNGFLQFLRSSLASPPPPVRETP